MDSADLAATTAAFAAGYADDRERQDWMRLNPGLGIAAGWDPDPDPWRPPVRGLGYAAGVDPVPVFVADSPAMAPSSLPTPLPIDYSAGPALTGATHGGWGSVPGAAMAGRGESIAYMGLGDARPPRRSLWARLRKGR
jgi:hypothetical protein